MSRPFVDTSAFAKLYLTEPDSRGFERWFADAMPVTISQLGVVELTSAPRKYARMGDLSTPAAADIERAFQADIGAGCMVVVELPPSTFHLARALLATHGERGLRTLDALQLASALECGAVVFATADSRLAPVARASGLQLLEFAGTA